MKRTFIAVALLMVLGTMTVGCQKENITDPVRYATEVCAEKTLHYSIDGMHFSQTVNSEEEYDTLLMKLMALAREE